MYHNVPAQTSQINFCQQQQQQQQQQQHQSNNQQPMQCQQYYCYPSNQQGGTLGQNQYVQAYQQDPYGINQQQQPIQRTGLANVGQALAQTSYNVPSIMQPQGVGYGSLPLAALDQIRSYIGTPGPIFILPSNCPNPGSQPAQTVPVNPPVTQGCPGIGINCPSSGLHGCPGGGCYPYPIPIAMNPLLSPYYQQQHGNASKESKNCGCCPRKSVGQEPQQTSQNISGYQWRNEVEEHRCARTNDDTICSRNNCPSALNLQALASQLLAIPGVIPCAATRIVLRKIPGSNITTSMEETMERAKRSLVTLTKDQLLAESRGAQQVNALINLHMTANPPINVIPILTTLQLKVNLLKSQVDASLNRRLSENQGLGGAEGEGNLDSVMLATKSDEELRDLLGTLRKKECDERVNLNFAPYKSQRSIAQSRLTNVQNKIAQIEEEMDRRRASFLPRSSMGHQVSHQLSDPGCAAWFGYTGDINNANWTTTTTPQNYESPDPFSGIQVRNPKRLNLKPHVGSPETTYENTTKTSKVHSSRSRKESDEEDCEDHEKRTKRSTSPETRSCHCDKSSDEDSPDEAKKKLGVKIHGAEEIVVEKVRDKCADNCAVSVVKLSPNVTIVIDNTRKVSRKETHRCDGHCQEKTERGKDGQKENYFDSEGKGIVGSTGEKEEKNLFIPSAPPMSPTEEPPEERKGFKGAIKKLKLREQKIKPTALIAVSDSRTMEKVDKMNYNIDAIENSVNKTEYHKNKMAGTLDKVEDKKYKNLPSTNPSDDRTNRSNIENSTHEPIREETVRMITKIQYEPTPFRAFDENDTEMEKIVEERYKGRPFREDSSLKSTSTESTVGSNFTNESISLRVENYDESLVDSADQMNPRKTLEPVEKKESPMREIEQKEVPEKNHKNRTISSKTKIDKRKKMEEETRKVVVGGVEERDEGRNDLISGALSTIGNHVASFGSIIGKIATLKLHNGEESSHGTLSDEKSKIVESVEGASTERGGKEEEEKVIGSMSEETSKMNKTGDTNKKEIGRWKYIRFSEVQESTNTSLEDLNSNGNNATYTLPKIKHSVIENKNIGGGKYVVVEKPSKGRKNHELGEPYKTGRSLVIRSRLKSPQADEQSVPFTVVRGPKKKDKNCIALSLANVKSLGKNQRLTKEIKTSDKFWLKPETRDETKDIAGSSKVNESLVKKTKKDKSELLNLHFSPTNDPRDTIDTISASTDEYVVTVHDYSNICRDSQSQIIETSKKP